MSRFYEALKQASQALRREEGTRNREQDSEFGIRDSEFVPEQQVPIPDSRPMEEQDALVALLNAESVPEAPTPSPESRVPNPDSRFPNPDSLPRNGSLGVLTEAALNPKARLIPNAMEPMVLEYYRAARTKIMQRRQEKMFQTLLVTSANPKEGKSVTTMNLALTFSMLPAFKVLVVDGDLRRGQITEWLGIDHLPGLANLLEGSAKLNEVVLKSDRIPFYFMARGSSELSPPDLLHTSGWRTFSQKLAERFDLILVDSPPANVVTDAQLLANGCDAVVLVARAFHTSQTTLEKLTNHELRAFRVVGTILNGGSSNGRGRYYSYYPGNAKENGKEAGKDNEPIPGE